MCPTFEPPSQELQLPLGAVAGLKPLLNFIQAGTVIGGIGVTAG